MLSIPDARRTLVARFTVQPGAQLPWHTHPAPVIVKVVRGELVYIRASDCVERAYPAGSAFVDPGPGNVHAAFNPSDSVPTLFVATFLDFRPRGLSQFPM